MKVCFRTDSSQLIGSGHMMRCLNLAKFLSLKKVDLFFISRKHFGNINYLIVENGIKLYELESLDAENNDVIYENNNYKQWLGFSESSLEKHKYLITPMGMDRNCFLTRSNTIFYCSILQLTSLVKSLHLCLLLYVPRVVTASLRPFLVNTAVKQFLAVDVYPVLAVEKSIFGD